MSDQEQSKRMSEAMAEIGRLKSEIKIALVEFSQSNGAAALARLKNLVEPKPQIHILVFPATPETLHSVCGERKFGSKDFLMPSAGSIDPELLKTHVMCEKCGVQRTIP